MAVEVTYQGFEYREQGREIHRRPVNRERLTAWEASWLVLKKGYDFIPDTVVLNFEIARNTEAVN